MDDGILPAISRVTLFRFRNRMRSLNAVGRNTVAAPAMRNEKGKADALMSSEVKCRDLQDRRPVVFF
jgi:hypothetical protein